MLSKKEYKYLKDLGLMLRQQRLKKKMSQAQVTFELETSTKHYQRIEYGEIKANIITLKRLADIFDIDLIEII